jgi:hypothetical protein
MMSDYTPFAIQTPYVLQPDDKLYFLHIQKTAGTALMEHIQLFFARAEIVSWHSELQNTIDDLYAYRLYIGHAGYKFLDKFHNIKPLWMTLLRHPVDRVISHYYFLLQLYNQDIENNRPTTQLRKLVTDSSNLHDFITNSRIHFHNVQVSYLYQHGQGGFQNTEQDMPPNVLDIVKDRLINECAFLGITDRYDDSIALLHYTFGWRPYLMKRQKRVNVTKDRPKINEVDSKIIDLIIEQNQLDIELYNFAVDLFSKRYDEMMRRLLQEHYEEHFQPLSNNNTNIILAYSDAIFDQKQYTSGWYQAEANYRWTGPEAISWIRVHLQSDHHHILEIEMECGVTDEILKTFSVSINNHDINLVSFNIPNGIIFRGSINQHLLQHDIHYTEIQFKVSHTMQPNETLEDKRLLGVALHNIRISRIK